jgi:energy-coupling factor transporter transmembrane protein EcfT
MSVGIFLIEMIPGIQIFIVLWWLAAGWGAVFLYRRLTGIPLTVKAGARLGSITGILIFLGMTIIIAFTMLVTGKEVFQEIVKQNPQISPVLDDPAELTLAVLFMVCFVFAMVVGTCAAGGALAARFARRGGAGDTHAA